MALEDLTAQQINSFIANYENSGKIEGGNPTKLSGYCAA